MGLPPLVPEASCWPILSATAGGHPRFSRTTLDYQPSSDNPHRRVNALAVQSVPQDCALASSPAVRSNASALPMPLPWGTLSGAQLRHRDSAVLGVARQPQVHRSLQRVRAFTNLEGVHGSLCGMLLAGDSGHPVATDREHPRTRGRCRRSQEGVIAPGGGAHASAVTPGVNQAM